MLGETEKSSDVRVQNCVIVRDGSRTRRTESGNELNSDGPETEKKTEFGGKVPRGPQKRNH